MLPGYMLTVDIVCYDTKISEEQFREQVAPSLAHLDALKGAFDRSPSTKNYHYGLLEDESDEQEYWKVRAVVMISVGKERGTYLGDLYMAIADLIYYEMPQNFDVVVSYNEIKF